MYRLDEQSFRALSSKTRVALLKALKSRNYTITELAAHLDKTAPTIKEHVTSLSRAGLIRKIDGHHKWKYYALTKKGKSIFDTERTFALDLVVMIIGAVGFISSLLYSYIDAQSRAFAMAPMESIAMGGANDMMAQSMGTVSLFPQMSVILMVLAFLFAAVVLVSLVRVLRR